MAAASRRHVFEPARSSGSIHRFDSDVTARGGGTPPPRTPHRTGGEISGRSGEDAGGCPHRPRRRPPPTARPCACETVRAGRTRPRSSTPRPASPRDAVPADAPPGTAVGSRLGDYVLERELGRGAMGVVFAAVHVRHGTPVALKTLPSVDGSTLHRFKQEFRAASELKPPAPGGPAGTGLRRRAMVLHDGPGGGGRFPHPRAARRAGEPRPAEGGPRPVGRGRRGAARRRDHPPRPEAHERARGTAHRGPARRPRRGARLRLGIGRAARFARFPAGVPNAAGRPGRRRPRRTGPRFARRRRFGPARQR